MSTAKKKKEKSKHSIKLNSSVQDLNQWQELSTKRTMRFRYLIKHADLKLGTSDWIKKIKGTPVHTFLKYLNLLSCTHGPVGIGTGSTSYNLRGNWGLGNFSKLSRLNSWQWSITPHLLHAAPSLAVAGCLACLRVRAGTLRGHLFSYLF